MYANVLITNSAFTKNAATQRSRNIFVGFSNMYLTSTNFKGISYSNYETQASKEETMGTFLFVSYDTMVYASKCTFLNGVASYGGAIYVSGKSSLTLLQSEFKANYAKYYGGAVYAEGFNTLWLGKSTSLTGNRALKYGDDFYLLDSVSTFTLDTVTISNAMAISSIYAESVQLSLKSVTAGPFN